MDTRTLLLKLLITLVALSGCSSSASDHLVNVSKLEKFVDELPHMPKILGYHLSDGVPKSKSLKIGMFKKKWVCTFFLSFFQLIINCLKRAMPSFFYAGFDDC